MDARMNELSFGYLETRHPLVRYKERKIERCNIIIIGIDHRDDEDGYPMMRFSCRRRRWFRNARRRDDRGYYHRAWRREWTRA